MTPSPSTGYYDTPYIYSKVYAQLSTSAITGSTANYPDTIPNDGDSDFFARRAVNMYNFNDAVGQSFITISPTGIQTQATAVGFDMPLTPEKLYPRGTGFPILLVTVNGQIQPNIASLTYTGALASIACPIFQGIKRRKGTAVTTPNYPFYEKPYTYVLGFTQNWTYLLPPYTTLRIAPARSFYKTVLNYDFELQAVEFSADFDNNNTGQNTYNGYMVKLYDANGYALMRDFVHYRQLSYNGGFAGNTKTSAIAPGDTLVWYPNCFPVPPLVYPKGSNIQIDIMSLLDTSVTGGSDVLTRQKIHFRGVNRMPC